MSVTRHWCPPAGKIRLGSELDCPKCWTAMVDSVDLSFPGAPEPYEAGIIPVDPDETSREVQSPKTRPCPCSSCDPRTCAYCGRQDHRCTFCTHLPPVPEACSECGYLECRCLFGDGHA